jgi:glutathione S-transferase
MSSLEVRLFGSRLSPFVEKVARALLLKKIDFALVEPKSPRDFARWNPQTGKMPVLEVRGDRVYDSTFILRKLDEAWPRPPLVASHAPIAASQRQLEDWSDESLYWYGMALRWSAKNAPAAAAQIFGALPALVRPLARSLGGRRIRASTRAQGLGRLPEDVLLRELAHHLDDLVTILGEEPFFFAGRPSIADLAIYGQLRVLRSGPTPDAARLIDEHPPLVQHMERVERETASAAGNP